MERERAQRIRRGRERERERRARSPPHAKKQKAREQKTDERQGMGAREWQPPHVRCEKMPSHYLFYILFKKTKKQNFHFFSIPLTTWEGGSRHVIMSHTYAYHMANPLPLPTTINRSSIYHPILLALVCLAPPTSYSSFYLRVVPLLVLSLFFL